MKVIKNMEKCNIKYDKLDMNVESLMLKIYNHIHQSCGIKIMTSFWFFLTKRLHCDLVWKTRRASNIMPLRRNQFRRLFVNYLMYYYNFTFFSRFYSYGLASLANDNNKLFWISYVTSYSNHLICFSQIFNHVTIASPSW